MKLTKTDFNKIRPLQWTLKEYGNQMYNTLVDIDETRLFWLDFIAHVFAPKFKNQHTITNIYNFDLEQPVLLTDSLDIVLPDELATVMYFSENTDNAKIFTLNFVTVKLVVIISLLVYAILTVFMIVKKKYTPRQII